ncbi:hypothetical protein Asi02nite_37390 [Asanoa siamensis]|uniref:Uncharacterized protein n=1 Tax=Asanoa siamensis TaxID=926357 RepID=A0ABQ4CSE8_9ACTN|nr:hypothetical protein Asi02nite_37390 [Asanoa siamensis]
MEWVRVWEVTTTWHRALDSPHGTTKLVEQARTAAELRTLVMAARADPLASYSQRSIRVLDGDASTHCRNKHRYWVPHLDAGRLGDVPVRGPPRLDLPGRRVRRHSRRAGHRR